MHNAFSPKQPFWPFWGRSRLYQRHFEGVLGTALEIQIKTPHPQQAPQAEAAILNEIDRLEAIFSRFYPSSELNRWQQQPQLPLSPELFGLLQKSQRFQALTQGAFNPASQALSQLWQQAEASQTLPDPAVLQALVAQIQLPQWKPGAGRTAPRTTALPLNLNAIAKGYIADQAAQAGLISGVEAVLVNLGGDLRHAGLGGVPVAIENPFSPNDNGLPVAQIQVSNQGLASSGHSRRGFKLGGRWFSHLLDPRTGYPAEQTLAASVMAPDAAIADVLSTAFSVMGIGESLELSQRLGVACLLITPQATYPNFLWQQAALA